jgi:hypothetical protein
MIIVIVGQSRNILNSALGSLLALIGQTCYDKNMKPSTAQRGYQQIAVSKPLLLYSLHHPRLFLKAPIAVSLEYDADQVTAYAHDLEVFGYGETEIEALSDLRRTVCDLYFELAEHHKSLEGEARSIWKYLSQIIEGR